jgi:hypothetical protein
MPCSARRWTRCAPHSSRYLILGNWRSWTSLWNGSRGSRPAGDHRAADHLRQMAREGAVRRGADRPATDLHAMDRARFSSMAPDPASFSIDRERLERDLDAARAYVNAGSRWRDLRQIAQSAAIFFVAVTVAPAVVTGDLSRAFDVSAPGYWTRFMLMASLGIMLGFWKVRLLSRQPISDVTFHEDRIATDWRRLTQGAWIARTVGTGVLMGLAIGVPVGALLAWRMPSDEYSPLSLAATFVGVTMAWTIPAAFLMRGSYVRRYRPLIIEG